MDFLAVKLLNCLQLVKFVQLIFTSISSHVCFSFQASAYASEDGTLTEEMIDKKLRDALESHRKKVEWRAEEER